jgi:RNA polymerase sigma factor (sigma-70 family)
MEDRQLLADYARTGSEAAFAQLVERHLGLVHTAARRQVQDDALAADVAQAVFLLLARKAGSLGGNIVLSGWLFRTTRFVAARAQRAEGRRQRREQEALAMQELHTPDPHWNRLAPELDEALAGLAEADRNALLLRFAEGRNHREVGVALGLTEEAAKKRVNRALDKLRGVLAGKGVTLTVVLLAGLLTDRLSAAPPAGLAASIAHGVATGIAPAGMTAGLVQQTVSAWRWAKVKFAAAACVGAVALVGVVFRGDLPGLGRPDSAAPTATAATEVAAPMAPAAAHQPGIPPRLNGTETFRLHVIAADTGQPLPGAKVLLNFVANGEWFAPEDRETDGEGVCVIPLPRNVGRAGCRRAFSRLREPLFRVDFEVATPAPRRLHAQTGPCGNGRWTCGG